MDDARLPESEAEYAAFDQIGQEWDDDVCPWCKGDMRDVGAELIDTCPMCGEKL